VLIASERVAPLTGAGPVTDAESREWLASLRSADDVTRGEAVARLHGLLLRAARFEVRRRAVATAHVTGPELDDLAQQSADDALVAVLGKLERFRGESRFTTWARKFAVFEAGAKVRRHAWQGREILLEPGAWLLLADRVPTPQQHAETRDLLEALLEGIKSQLTTRQREVLVAVAVNDVPIDVLAERLNTTRGALYKTIHDARHKLRAALAARGLNVDQRRGGRAGELT
jgi:RNA polymerase sigma-70 factor, ECF subfamily